MAVIILLFRAEYKSRREFEARVLDAVKVAECHITSLKSIEVVGHEIAITYNLWLLSKMNEPFDPARTGSYKDFC